MWTWKTSSKRFLKVDVDVELRVAKGDAEMKSSKAETYRQSRMAYRIQVLSLLTVMGLFLATGAQAIPSISKSEASSASTSQVPTYWQYVEGGSPGEAIKLGRMKSSDTSNVEKWLTSDKDEDAIKFVEKYAGNKDGKEGILAFGDALFTTLKSYSEKHSEEEVADFRTKLVKKLIGLDAEHYGVHFAANKPDEIENYPGFVKALRWLNNLDAEDLIKLLKKGKNPFLAKMMKVDGLKRLLALLTKRPSTPEDKEEAEDKTDKKDKEVAKADDKKDEKKEEVVDEKKTTPPPVLPPPAPTGEQNRPDVARCAGSETLDEAARKREQADALNKWLAQNRAQQENANELFRNRANNLADALEPRNEQQQQPQAQNQTPFLPTASNNTPTTAPADPTRPQQPQQPQLQPGNTEMPEDPSAPDRALVFKPVPTPDTQISQAKKETTALKNEIAKADQELKSPFTDPAQLMMFQNNPTVFGYLAGQAMSKATELKYSLQNLVAKEKKKVEKLNEQRDKLAKDLEDADPATLLDPKDAKVQSDLKAAVKRNKDWVASLGVQQNKVASQQDSVSLAQAQDTAKAAVKKAQEELDKFNENFGAGAKKLTDQQKKSKDRLAQLDDQISNLEGEIANAESKAGKAGDVSNQLQMTLLAANSPKSEPQQVMNRDRLGGRKPTAAVASNAIGGAMGKGGPVRGNLATLPGSGAGGN
jgi:hypothetical protein